MLFPTFCRQAVESLVNPNTAPSYSLSKMTCIFVGKPHQPLTRHHVLSENRVPLTSLVYHHFPCRNLPFGEHVQFRHTQISYLWLICLMIFQIYFHHSTITSSLSSTLSLPKAGGLCQDVPIHHRRRGQTGPFRGHFFLSGWMGHSTSPSLVGELG